MTLSISSPPPGSLDQLIDAYAVATAAWDLADPDGNCDGPEYADREAVEDAILRYSCGTLDEVKAKARFFLDNEGAYDTIQNCSDEREECLLPFLRSLLGEERP